MDDWQFYKAMQDGFSRLEGLLIQIRDRIPLAPNISFTVGPINDGDHCPHGNNLRFGPCGLCDAQPQGLKP